KFSRATTDSGREVRFDPVNKPEISNLLGIYTHCSGMPIAEIEALYEGRGYGDFKKDLAEHVVNTLAPIQERYHEIRSSGELEKFLRNGAERASEVAEQKLREVKEKMGFVV